jgi:hypothetical protein
MTVLLLITLAATLACTALARRRRRRKRVDRVAVGIDFGVGAQSVVIAQRLADGTIVVDELHRHAPEQVAELRRIIDAEREPAPSIEQVRAGAEASLHRAGRDPYAHLIAGQDRANAEARAALVDELHRHDVTVELGGQHDAVARIDAGTRTTPHGDALRPTAPPPTDDAIFIAERPRIDR